MADATWSNSSNVAGGVQGRLGFDFWSNLTWSDSLNLAGVQGRSEAEFDLVKFGLPWPAGWVGHLSNLAGVQGRSGV